MESWYILGGVAIAVVWIMVFRAIHAINTFGDRK